MDQNNVNGAAQNGTDGAQQQTAYAADGQPINVNVHVAAPEPLSGEITNVNAPYPHKNSDITLFKVAFAFQILSTVCCAIFVIPLAWMIPMSVIGYKMSKGEKANTVAWGVCNLIFLSVVSGILYLIADKDQ